MKMKKTIGEWSAFNQAAEDFNRENKDETKFLIALRKQVKVIGKALEGYNLDVEDARIEHCAVDEKSVVKRDAQGGYVFTKEGLRAFRAATKKLMEATLECDVFIHRENLASLPPKFAEYFTEFIEGIQPDSPLAVVGTPPIQAVDNQPTNATTDN